MKVRMISEELKRVYGQKIYRLALTSGCTCPNRDGTLGTGGCSFCSAGGSGEFAAPLLPVAEQIALAKKLVDGKIPASVAPEDRRYIAYFQSYTNTYGDTERLRALYTETVRRPEIVILSVGTRPDCLQPDKIAMLAELNRVKPVWVELGLQTVHEKSALRIRRGYPLTVYEDAFARLKRAGLQVITHVILGLPGESEADMLETVRYLSTPGSPGCAPDGIKLQLLHVLRGTELGEEYLRSPFRVFTLEEYTALVVKCLRLLPPQTVVHRLTGDGAKRLLLAPMWSADKKRVLNTLNRAIREA